AGARRRGRRGEPPGAAAPRGVRRAAGAARLRDGVQLGQPFRRGADAAKQAAAGAAEAQGTAGERSAGLVAWPGPRPGGGAAATRRRRISMRSGGILLVCALLVLAFLIVKWFLMDLLARHR